MSTVTLIASIFSAAALCGALPFPASPDALDLPLPVVVEVDPPGDVPMPDLHPMRQRGQKSPSAGPVELP